MEGKNNFFGSNDTFLTVVAFINKSIFLQNYKPFSKQIRDIELSSMSPDEFASNGNIALSKSEGEFDQYEKYPLDILLAPNEKLPNRVDPLKKEVSVC